MSMADDISRERNKERKQRSQDISIDNLHRDGWEKNVNTLSKDFARSARELGVKPHQKNILFQPFWKVHVPLTFRDYSARNAQWIKIDKNGNWEYDSPLKVPFFGEQSVLDTYATYEEMKESFINTLKRPNK